MFQDTEDGDKDIDNSQPIATIAPPALRYSERKKCDFSFSFLFFFKGGNNSNNHNNSNNNNDTNNILLHQVTIFF